MIARDEHVVGVVFLENLPNLVVGRLVDGFDLVPLAVELVEDGVGFLEFDEDIVGVSLRFVSLIVISYLSVTILAFVFNAPATFGAGLSTTAKAISIDAIFSVVGAATADSLF